MPTLLLMSVGINTIDHNTSNMFLSIITGHRLYKRYIKHYLKACLQVAITHVSQACSTYVCTYMDDNMAMYSYGTPQKKGNVSSS